MPAEFDAYPFEAGEGSFLTEFRWSEMFRWMRTDGVITRNPPELLPNVDLDVSPASGMSIQIAPGQAIIRGVFWLHRDSPYEMPIITNLDSYPRIDLVVLRCDFDVNTMYYDIVQGVPDPNPVAPVPEDDSETVTEIPLATVLVRPSTEAEDITDADITDMRIRSVQANSGSSPLIQGEGISIVHIGDRILLSCDCNGGGEDEEDKDCCKKTPAGSQLIKSACGVTYVGVAVTYDSSNVITGIPKYLPFNGTRYDFSEASSMHNDAIENEKIIIPEDGLYLINLKLFVYIDTHGSQNESVFFSLYKNLTSELTRLRIFVDNRNPLTPQHINGELSYVERFAKDDFLRVRITFTPMTSAVIRVATENFSTTSQNPSLLFTVTKLGDF